MTKKRVLIVYRSYFPAVSHLGPATAIRNLVTNMSSEYDFHIFTLNYNTTTGSQLFENPHHFDVQPNCVVEFVPRGPRSIWLLAQRLRDNFKVVDVQCAFDPLLAIPALTLCKLGLAPRSKLFHTPHGIFMNAVMTTREARKRFFCRAADVLGLYKNVTHLAGSVGEKEDVERHHISKQTVRVVSQFVETTYGSGSARTKPQNRLKVAFVGRVTSQKNLEFALQVMGKLSVPSSLDIFGDTRDTDYYTRCRAIAQKSPGKCEVRFVGAVDKSELLRRLPEYDVLFHPTLGENFGHAIVEAINLGLPVLTSDQCPWVDVETYQAGWSLPLSDIGGFVEKLETLYAMGSEWSALQAGAARYARETFDSRTTSQNYRAAYG